MQSGKYSVEQLAATETILKCALKIPRSLFCPYCADEYMFDFSLKDHLLKIHLEELKLERVQSEGTHSCPFCAAVFYMKTVIPKHVLGCHGEEMMRTLQDKHPEFFDKSGTEPSVIYAACSPGLSDIFDRLDTNGSPTKSVQKPKSILKKTPIKHSPYKTIQSPGVVSTRRTKKEMIKRTLSARRELRFDLPPLENSPVSPEVLNQSAHGCFSLKNFFRKPKAPDDEYQPKPKKKRSNDTPNIVTSTPINFLQDEIDSPKKFSKKKLKMKFAQNFRPLLFASERFQCADCKEKYNCNGDLLFHIKNQHKGFHFILRPKYQCGQCGDHFFRNSHLVRHCHFQHTPQKCRI